MDIYPAYRLLILGILCGVIIVINQASVTTAEKNDHVKDRGNKTLDVDSPANMETSEEKRLIKKLLRRYQKAGQIGRPVKNASATLGVEFGLGLIKMDVLEKENMLTMSVWTRYRWKDEYMTWDPADFGGVSSIKVPTSRIWMPDIMLYNTASTEKMEREVLAVIGADGTVSWYPHRIFHSSCSIDVRRFPFDNQTCHIWFGSWTHPVEEVDLRLAFPQGIDLSTFQSDFKETSKWDIDRCDANKIGDDQPGGFAVLAFTLHLQRRMIFSGYILTFPVVFLSFLTLLVFWLPADSADKSSLGLTIFGSLLLLLLILVEAAPPTASAVPLLGIYYCFNIVIVMLSIFLSTIVAKLGEQRENRKPVPNWVKVVMIDVLSRVLCLKRPKSIRIHRRAEKAGKGAVGAPAEAQALRGGGQANGYPPPGGQQWDDELTLAISTLERVCTDGSPSSPREKIQMRSVVEAMRGYMRDKCEEDSNSSRAKIIQEEWKFVALVLDRIFLVVYIIVIAISLVFLFPR